MQTPVAHTESRSQRRRVVSFIRSLSVRRQSSPQPRSQRGQLLLPQQMDADVGAALKDFDGPAAFKSDSSLVIVNNGEEERNARNKIRNKLQRAKTILHSIRRTTPRYRGRASTTQLEIPNSVHEEPLNPVTMEREERDVSTTPLHAEGDRRKSSDDKVAEQTATESREIEKLRQDLSDSFTQIAELQKRCEAQSRDLENSNSFFNAADKSSDSDVIHAFQRLNAEVEQDATYMAEYLTKDLEFQNMTNPTKEQISAGQRASEFIGLVLAKSLETPKDILMLLQTAFQAYFASALGQAVSSWVFEPGNNAFIHGVYQRLREVEAQAISGRWRAITRVHIVHNWITHPKSLVEEIIAGISDILLAAGCTAPRSGIISKVTYEFEEKIALLVELAGRLNKMFSEVISSDFEVLVVQPGEKFEGKNMEDADDAQAGFQAASVLCATHLGLIKRVPMGSLWEKGRKQKMVVLKAKVLLESFLNVED